MGSVLKILLGMMVLVSVLASAAGPGATSKGITVYSARKAHLLKPVVALYKKETGQDVDVVTGDAGVLIQRLKQEGANTPADVFITVDAGNLWFAAEQGLLQPVASKALELAIPKDLRDDQGRWFGFSLRARTIFYNKKTVDVNTLESYENLASPEFRNKLCLRTSRKVYNQSLVASFIERYGSDRTQQILAGWVKNLAKPVFTSDTLLLKAIQRGQCSVGIANTYYLARLIKDGLAKDVGIFWPNQMESPMTPKSQGVHVNISGGGVVSESDSVSGAIQFLEFLSSKKAQKVFADVNDEYPVREGVELSPLLKTWGAFKKDTGSLNTYGAQQKAAIQLMDKVKYR